MSTLLRRGRRSASSLLVLALTVTGLTAVGAGAAGAAPVGSDVTVQSETTPSADLPSPAPLLQRDDNVVTSDPIPTVQIDNGYVWAQVMVGDTVYAVGDFDNARAPQTAPGTNLTARSNILAYNIRSGALLPYNPQVNGVIKAVAASPDGSRIYIGGSFNQVNGQARWNFAALDAQTGALIPGFTPSVGGSGVYALATQGDTVYLGGLFTRVNGVDRKNLAAIHAGNGALTGWAPTTDRQVDAMVIEPGGEKVVAGGRFYTVNDAVQRGLVALDATSGVPVTEWEAPHTVINGWSTGTNAGRAGIFGLAVDNDAVYGTGWVYANASVGNLEGVFAAEAGSGAIRWVADCLGDHYGVWSTGEVVYATNHVHACSTLSLHPEQSPREHRYVVALTAETRGKLTRNPHTGTTYQNWEGTPSPSPYAWYPDFAVGLTSGLGQAGLSIVGKDEFIAVAGEFRSVNNGQFEGIVRFSTTPPQGAKDGPRVSGASWTPTAQSVAPGRATVTIPSNWDRDDMNLTYELRREGRTTPVATVMRPSMWWSLPAVKLTDADAPPGSTQTYRVVVRDGDGNSVTSQPATVTIAAGAISAYASSVLDDEPLHYWRLGQNRQDWAGNPDPLFGSAVGTTTPGPVNEPGSSASTFNGTTNSRVSGATSTRAAGTNTFTTEIWFRTTTNQGGKLIGFGNNQTGSSGSYDRHIYMRNDGRLHFGTYTGVTNVILSPQPYNDGQWHQAVASLGSDGMKLYVDGALVASNAAVTTGEGFTGFWRVGGDNLGSWPNRPSSDYFSGSIAEVAVFNRTLSAADISGRYAIGAQLEQPTADFSSSVEELQVAFDGRASTAPGGATITNYRWDFGDGTPVATGAQVNHTYTAGGTYAVKLTVTDSRGLSHAVTKQVEVVAPNELPEAEFTANVEGLVVTVNGGGSSDPDGQIESYSWNWGDGSPAGSGVNATHTYATAGEFTITLTVTDNRGGTDSATRDVTVHPAGPTAVVTVALDGLRADFDASGSSSAAGTTLTFDWDFGDGQDGTGATTTHTYAEAGSFDVTLVVRDNLGRESTVVETVTVATEPLLASDHFGRTVAQGWGTADTGGAWQIATGATSTSVVDGRGLIQLAPGGTRVLDLPGAVARDVSLQMSYSLNNPPSGGAVYVGPNARQVGSSRYSVLAWHRDNGTVWLVAQRNGVTIATAPLSGMTWGANEAFNLEVEVEGTTTTAIRAKAWKVGSNVPSSWQLQTTDAQGLAEGLVGVRTSKAASGSVTTTVAVSSFIARDLNSSSEVVPPVAAFEVTTDALSINVDGSGSSQQGGSIQAYSWSFGDGSTASGAIQQHTYAEAGTYAVVLSVTGASGLTDSTTRQVVVTDPAGDPEPEPGVLASDAFSRNVSSGWGAADAGGSWQVASGASTTSVANGQGFIALQPGHTRLIQLPQVDARDVLLNSDYFLSSGPSTGAVYVGVTARQVGSTRYSALAWHRDNGTVWLVIQRNGTAIASGPVAGLTWGPEDAFHLEVQVEGTSSTSVSAKIWKSGTAEPSSWQIAAQDSTGPLIQGGAVGVHASKAASAAGPATVAFTSFQAITVE